MDSSNMIWFDLLLIAITAIYFYRIGLRTDIDIDIEVESYNAGIAEGVAGTLKVMEEQNVIRRNKDNTDYEMPLKVWYEDDSPEAGN